MGVFKRGKACWYEFSFQGQRIRESAHTSSYTAAVQIERERRRNLELSAGGVRQLKPLLFSGAAKEWLATNANWSEGTREIYADKMRHLVPTFGKLLLGDITSRDIDRFQSRRRKDGASAREVNMECGVLRMVLRKNRVWHLLAPDYKPLREREDIGKALTPDEMLRMLTAAKQSRSRSLYPALVLLLNTGLRSSELRGMKWRQVDLLERTLAVGLAKTRGGEGRVVPLNEEAYSALVNWRREFENPLPDHYIFCSERYGGNLGGKTGVYDRQPEKPMGSWKVSWSACRTASGVRCRLHDLRHTFVSRLAEGQVSDQTIMALAGWMSRKMMERYSHARNAAKRQAVANLYGAASPSASPQFPPQLDREVKSESRN